MRRTLLLPALALAASACASQPRGTWISPEDLQRMERADAAARAGQEPTAAAAKAPGSGFGDANLSPERAKQRNEIDDRTLKLERRREDRTRALAELEAKRARTALEQASAEASELMAVQQTDRDRRVAAEDLAHFLDVERARRLAEDALDLVRSKDGLLETREELAQLEMMYSESSLGDATAEIVLNRTRRRLQRAEEGHRLRSDRSGELTTITLPREQQRLELELAAKTVALDNSQRTRDAGRLSRQAVLRDLDLEARKQQREAEDLEVEARRLQQDIERFERDLAADRSGTSPAGGAGNP